MSNECGLVACADIRLEGCVPPRRQPLGGRGSIQDISLMPWHRIESGENGESYDERHN